MQRPEPASPLLRPSGSMLLLALLVAPLGAWASWFWLALPGRLPTEDDHRALAAALAARRGPGDAVLAAPAWAQRARAFVPGLLDLDPATLDLDDLHGAPVLWVVAAPGLPRSPALELLENLAANPELAAGERRRFGELLLARFVVTRPPPRFDFRAALPAARVFLRGAEEVACPFDGSAFRCPGGAWNRVAVEHHEVERRGRLCIWAHPVGPAPLAVEFTGVTLGPLLRGGFGFASSSAALAKDRPGVELAIRIDGLERSRLALAPGDERWQRFELPVPGAAGAEGSRTVTFEVTTPDAGRRHFCFDAVAP